MTYPKAICLSTKIVVLQQFFKLCNTSVTCIMITTLGLKIRPSLKHRYAKYYFIVLKSKNLLQHDVFCRYCSRKLYEQLFQLAMNCVWSTRNESHCSFNLLTVFLLKRKEVFYLVSYLYVAVNFFSLRLRLSFCLRSGKMMDLKLSYLIIE